MRRACMEDAGDADTGAGDEVHGGGEATRAWSQVSIDLVSVTIMSGHVLCFKMDLRGGGGMGPGETNACITCTGVGWYAEGGCRAFGLWISGLGVIDCRQNDFSSSPVMESHGTGLRMSCCGVGERIAGDFL